MHHHMSLIHGVSNEFVLLVIIIGLVLIFAWNTKG